MKMLSGMRKQLEGELRSNGFMPEDASDYSLNAHDPGILHAVIFAGLYPNVGRVIQHGKRSLVETADANKVRLHPFSTNAKLSFMKSDSQPLVIFDEITRGEWVLNVRNCNVIGVLPLLLLATEIAVAPPSENDDEDDESDNEEDDDSDSDEDKTESHNLSNHDKIMSSPGNVVKVVVDRWLPFESIALDVAQIYSLRERLSAAILFKVTNPKKVLPENLGYAIACILSYDVMSGISLPDAVDSLATLVGATDIGHSDHGRKMPMNQTSKNYLRSLIYPSTHNQGRSSYHSSNTVGINHHQKHVSGSPIVASHGSAMRVTNAARGGFSKRPRGNGHR